MKVPRAVGLALAAFLMLGLLPLPAASAIGVDDPHLRLGKIDPGHTSTHLRDVTNTGTSPITVDAKVVCPCPVYVTVSPERFELAPGAKQTLKIVVDVPADADPGAHDTQIQVTERSAGGSGGTAVASASISAFFQVRSATLFLNPPSGGDSIPVRFVNAYEETLEVTIEGTLEGVGVSRAVDPVRLSAGGSGPGARVTTHEVPLPFGDGDPMGSYTVTLVANWSNTTTGATGSSGPHRIDMVHGALILLQHFQAKSGPDGVLFTGTLRSLAATPLDAWLEVTLAPVAGGTAEKVETGHVTLDPRGSRQVSFHWPSDRSGAHTVRAQALYRAQDGEEGRSSAWPLTELVLSEATTDPASEGPATDSADKTQASPRPTGSTTVLGLVALAGLGVGATVAILVNRRAR